ncbi:MAG: HNH endonuclease [Verrucomicrobia bacterium]|nr:HNH endonuclease [Verrucomicrobiota bacterium]
MKKLLSGVYLNCEYCKKEIYKMKCKVKKHSFCSTSCSAKWKRERGISGKKKYEFYVTCPVCKITFHTCPSILKLRKSGIKFCSQSCKITGMKTGITKWSFQKTKPYSSNPYIRTQKNGIRMKEHRRIMEEYLNRKLLPNEHIHHINGDTKDNRLENLQILSPSEHSRVHNKKR